MEEGFMKGQADNLPKVDSFMVAKFLSENANFVSAEIRGVKLGKSARESYGDEAIGYVQVKRVGNTCTVKARVTPEHRVRSKAYHCTCICDEENENIEHVSCDDCAASLGGCKHAVALLMWIHRRSEEPATTSIKCYWTKPNLSNVGSSQKLINARDVRCGKRTVPELTNYNGIFLSKIIKSCKQYKTNAQVMNYFTEESEVRKTSLHYIISSFKQTTYKDVDTFMEYCAEIMTPKRCDDAEKATISQSDSKLWYELRYGRITASKCHEAAHCKTDNGVLVEQIFGANKLIETLPMARGKNIESDVRNEISKLKGIPIKQAGLFLKASHPILGASPDGITDMYVVEIKCPMSTISMTNYIKEGVLNDKYQTQIQMQMYFADKSKGLFCIAHPDFETTKQVDVYEIDFDKKFCNEIMHKCIQFWKQSVFKKLM